MRVWLPERFRSPGSIRKPRINRDSELPRKVELMVLRRRLKTLIEYQEIYRDHKYYD